MQRRGAARSPWRPGPLPTAPTVAAPAPRAAGYQRMADFKHVITRLMAGHVRAARRGAGVGGPTPLRRPPLRWGPREATPAGTP
jgi:hypothetical protein